MDNQAPRDIGEVMSDEMVMKDKIVAQLEKSPKTIPEIAEALGYPSREVVYWVMAMWRYGTIEETGRPDDEGYYHYRLKE